METNKINAESLYVRIKICRQCCICRCIIPSTEKKAKKLESGGFLVTKKPPARIHRNGSEPVAIFYLLKLEHSSTLVF